MSKICRCFCLSASSFGGLWNRTFDCHRLGVLGERKWTLRIWLQKRSLWRWYEDRWETNWDQAVWSWDTESWGLKSRKSNCSSKHTVNIISKHSIVQLHPRFRCYIYMLWVSTGSGFDLTSEVLGHVDPWQNSRKLEANLPVWRP